jgi:pantothenate kinase
MSLLTRIKTSTDTVYAPSFDRQADLSRGAAIEVTADTKIILAEGNYLLLKQSPWNLLAPLFDLTVFLDVPRDKLQQRLVQRWLDHGLQHTVALDKVISNDLPNAELVIDHSQMASYTLTN